MPTTSTTSSEGAVDSSSAVLQLTATNAEYNGVYWGEQGGAIRLKIRNAITALPSTEGTCTDLYFDERVYGWRCPSVNAVRLAIMSAAFRLSRLQVVNGDRRRRARRNRDIFRERLLGRGQRCASASLLSHDSESRF